MARQRPSRANNLPIDPAMQGMLKNFTQEMDNALKSSDAFALATKRLQEAQRGVGVAFAASTAALAGWTRAGLAGTTTGEMLSWQTKQLSMQITSLFLPAIERGIDRIQKITDWFRQLSGEQQNQIARWTAFGVSLMGSLVIIPRLTQAFTSMGGALALMVRNNPLTALIAGVTGLMAQTEEGRESLSELGSTLSDAFAPLAELLSEILLPAMQALADFMGTVGGQATALVAIILLGLQRIIMAVFGLRMAFLGVGAAITLGIGLIAMFANAMQKTEFEQATESLAKGVRSGRQTPEQAREELKKQLAEERFKIEEFVRGNRDAEGLGHNAVLAAALKAMGLSPEEIADRITKELREQGESRIARAEKGAPPHRDMTLARVGTEDAVATIRRLESSVLKTDYAKRTAEAAEGTEKGVNWFKDMLGKAFGKGTKLEADPKMDD